MTVLVNSLVIAGDPTWFSVPPRLIRDEPSLAPTVMLGENRNLDSEGKDKHLQGRRGFLLTVIKKNVHGTPFFMYN